MSVLQARSRTSLTTDASRRQSSVAAFEPIAALLRQLVVLRAAIGVRRAPARLQPAAAFEAMERRIERSLADLERVRRDLLQALARWPSHAAARAPAPSGSAGRVCPAAASSRGRPCLLLSPAASTPAYILLVSKHKGKTAEGKVQRAKGRAEGKGQGKGRRQKAKEKAEEKGEKDGQLSSSRPLPSAFALSPEP